MRSLALLLSLGLLCGLATAAPVLRSADNAAFHTLRPGGGEPLQNSPCDYCQDLMATVDQFVTDPDSQAAVAQYVVEAVCPGLPKDWRPICEQEVPPLVAQAAQLIGQTLAPSEVCAGLGVCPGSAAQALEGTPFDCPMCQMVVGTFIARLQDDKARAEIEAGMRKACDSLDAEAKARCLTDVAQLFAALGSLLHDLEPEGVCEVFDFCQGAARPRAPQAAHTLAAAARALATGGPAAAAAGSANGDMCANCKTIVLEAATILQDPKTQAELLDYAKQGCSMFQDFKDQCEAYVTLYGPLVFNMLVSYLQPDSLCTRLGYCHATAQLLAA